MSFHSYLEHTLAEKIDIVQTPDVLHYKVTSTVPLPRKEKGIEYKIDINSQGIPITNGWSHLSRYVN